MGKERRGEEGEGVKERDRKGGREGERGGGSVSGVGVGGETEGRGVRLGACLGKCL